MIDKRVCEIGGGTARRRLRQGGGWIFLTSLHFTTRKRPCLHYHNLQQDIATNTPAQYKLHACWHIVHACWHRLFYRHVRILCMLNLTQITRVIIHLSLERIILLCFHACRKTKMRYLHYVSRHQFYGKELCYYSHESHVHVNEICKYVICTLGYSWDIQRLLDYGERTKSFALKRYSLY